MSAPTPVRPPCDATYSRLVLDDNSGSVHRFTLRTFQLVLSVVGSLVAVVGTSLTVTWWMIGPRLDAHIDHRVMVHTERHVAEAHVEHERMRREWQVALASMQALQNEHNRRMEADSLYIRTRLDQLYNQRGGTR